MDSLLPLLLGGGAILVTVAILRAFFSHDAKVKRALGEAPLCTTAAFPESSVGTVQGKVCYLDGAPLIAPLTGRPCAYYEAIVEEWRPRGRGGSWYQIVSEHQGQDFLLDDGHGTARVMMGNATVNLVKDAHFLSGVSGNATPVLDALLDISNPSQIKDAHFGTFQAPTPMLAAFLTRHGYQSEGWTFRYREGVIEADEAVTVCGRGTREANPNPQSATGGYRETARRLVLAASPDTPLYVSDDMPTRH
jgi:hypothetical protein